MMHISRKKYHFIGAGGIGMSGLAKLMLSQGAVVSGSDQEATAVTQGLNDLGADIRICHSAANIHGPYDAVVISAAIRVNNPELTVAREQGWPVFKYAEMLGRVMDDYAGVAICGTHGKSTTSGWLTHVLVNAGVRPNFVVGADIVQLATNSGVGADDGLFIAEACEYDRSFLNLHPQIAVILNIEQDHLDYYRDEDDIVDAFTDFARGIRKGGTVIVNGDDTNSCKVISRLDAGQKCITFGLKSTCDLCAENIELVAGLYGFDVVYQGEKLGRTQISLPGRHNIYNALAVIAVAIAADVDISDVLTHLDEFTGIDRRLMLKMRSDTITVIDDYAHHPTEIRASLQAISQKYAPERILCIFQPHQYSRTRFLLDDFAESFKLAEITIVPDIYFVRDTEASKHLVNAEVLVDRIRQQGCQAEFIDTFDKIIDYLKENTRPGDLVVTMGAGDIWKVADEYIQWLGRNC